MSHSLGWALWVLLWTASCWGQSTEGLISGRVSDQVTGMPVARALIEYEQLATNTHGTSYSAIDGNYYIPLLPPGEYRVRASERRYQAREIYNVTLTVAGYLEINFDLRPLQDVWERGRYRSEMFRDNTVLPFFGPDVDPSYVGTFEPERSASGQLEPSISEVIDPKTIETLPLIGRDVYTALVLQPGVAADTATRRSLGLSANGQRPSSSNFLLDGIENNDQLLSGPAIQLAPEMVQEYRVSTSNFSAEYGRTAGYVANAVTRSAASQWHGIAYGDLNNDVLNSNTFEHNTSGLRRNTSHQIQSGFSVGGAVPHVRLFTWTALDYFGSRGFSDPEEHNVPTQAFAGSLRRASHAWQLLHDHPPIVWANSASGDSGRVELARPVTIRRVTGLERVDYSLSTRQRITGRASASEFRRPDFNWSPYGEAPLSMSNFGLSAAAISAWSPTVVSEVRGGIQTGFRGWDHVLADLPQILLESPQVALPGSCCDVGTPPKPSWSDRVRTEEFSANLAISRGPHLVKVGGAFLYVRLKSGFRLPAISRFQFSSLKEFGGDAPEEFIAPVSRSATLQGVYEQADTHRSYRYVQPYVFLQEDWRIAQRITLSAGFRFERFPAPVNDGEVQDVFFTPSPGPLTSANVSQHRGALFSSDASAPSVRLAFSYSLLPSRGTVLRGGYGTFYDRLSDNSWITASGNDLAFQTSKRGLTGCSATLLSNFYASGEYAALPQGCPRDPTLASLSVLNLTQFQAGLEPPRVQSLFLSLQQPFGRNLAIELNGAGSRGRNLLTTDIVNREFSASLPNIDFRAGEGFSDYAAFSASVRYRSGPLSFSTAYTWSHSIDNQSDPLLSDYFDLGFSNQTDRTQPTYYASFSRAGDQRVDRGNSDFDQRQNLVGWASMAVPAPRSGRLSPLLRGWTTALVFAVRSGLPFSVTGGITNCDPICNTRANLLNPSIANIRQAFGNGVRLLNRDAFSVPEDGQEGNTGRNAFKGPGFSDVDLSLARSLPVRRIGEQARLIIRADAFNLLNHPNLQNPETYLGYPNFGIALYGGAQQNSGFPSFTPLIENSRRIHFLLRLEF